MRVIADPGGASDPERLVARLDSHHRWATQRVKPAHLELYHRVSRGLRVGRRPTEVSPHVRVGREEGVAARLQRRGEGDVCFAAASGGGQLAIRCVIDRASGALPQRAPQDAEWEPRAGGSLYDHDPAEELPDPPTLEEWLERAWSSLAASRAVSDPIDRATLWVEVAETVETWVTDRGLKASRSRVRAWALIQPSPRTGEALPRPAFVARRRWQGFPESGWSEILGDRVSSTSPAEPAPARPMKLLFNPEASAKLVAALVRTVHTGERGLGSSVGPGWKLVDDPNDPDALFGGTFDDAVFRTRRRTLADGRQLVGLLEGQGNYRRPSFRDPPAPYPTHIVVEADRAGPPADGMLVSESQIHPLGTDWVIEVRGALLHEGRPVAPLRHGFLRIRPEDLVQRCLAAVGRPRSSHRGVRTPALLFDDLPLG